MEEFAKMVEVYKWRGGASNASHGAPSSPATHGEDESAGSGCTGSPPKRDDTHSSPSPSLLQKRVDVDSAGLPDRASSLAPGWHRPRQRPLANKKPRSLHNHSSRQLVFSVGETGAKDCTERRTRPKKMIKKNPRKRKKVDLKQDGTEYNSHVETGNLPDFYNDSECENGSPLRKEFYSPDEPYLLRQCFPSERATCHEGKDGAERTNIQPTHIYGKSPYFRHPKWKESANKDKDGLNNKQGRQSAKLKRCTKRRKKEGSFSKTLVADTIEIEHWAGHTSDSFDRDDLGRRSAHLPEQLMNSSDSSILSSKIISRIKKSAYFEATTNVLGQRDIANKTWVPPISVYGLIQEELYKDPWKVLVACMLLNKTNGKQMRKIIWDLFVLCPTPEAAVTVETSRIEDVIRGLGLQKKRARMIQKFSRDYLGKDWTHVEQLHGIGKYATDAYAIFCEGRWQEVKPEDHKLVDYWKYLCATDGLGYAFKDDREKWADASLQASSVET